ncbi:10369_t:CDS:2, partial [Gigaspora rosea]
MKKLFTILLILAIIGLGVAASTLPPTDIPATTGTNTLPPTNKPTPTDTNTLPPTDIPPTNTNSLPPSPSSTTAPPPDPFKNMTISCKNAIVEFFTSKDINTCLPLLPLLTANDSIKMVTALVQFANSKCKDPRCNADAINKGKENIKKGCLENDIKKDHNKVATMALLGTTLYSPIIESLCFQVSKNDPKFCFADTLSKLFTAPEPPFPSVFGFLDRVIFCTPTTFCTDCNHRISQEVFNFISDPNHKDAIETLSLFNITQVELTQFKLSTMIKCGSKFLKSNDTFP